jgi:transposase
MMGSQDDRQDQFFYAFNLEDRIPKNHLLRAINEVLDLSGLRQHLKPFYSHTGRPSIDPELMMRMLIIGYCFGIRSERRLCEEVHLNLAYRWFCRLSLEDAVPDHSTFSKNRHGRFRDSEAFRFVFEEVLQRCMGEGLVGGEGFAVDASVIRADASRGDRVEGTDEIDWSDAERARQPIREYLVSLDQDSSPEKPDRRISRTDPQSRWTAAPGGPAYYAYSTNYLIDTDQGMIVDVEATPANRTEEVQSTKTMLERTEERFGVKPERLIGDTAYGSTSMLDYLVEDKAIEPHVPVWDKSTRQDGSYTNQDFHYDPATNEYLCPGGKKLRTRGRINKDQTIYYRAKKADCTPCSLKPYCCPRTPTRRIARSVHESSRDVARRIALTPAYQQSRRDRKKVEMLFGHLKRILKLDRLRLRGLNGARDEFLMAATVQNLRRMAKLLSQPPPNPGLLAPA